MTDDSPAAPDPWIGRTIAGQFLIAKRLGAGGMGSVYLADQLGMDRQVVVKVIRSGLVYDPTLTERFRREARTIARLHHPNIVQVLTSGETDDGALYLAMEYVAGRNLEDEMRAVGIFPEARLLRLATQVAAALAAAHEAEVVHRDLKPANIMLTEYAGNPDHVVVLDFGIAKVLESEGDLTQLTGTGMMVGTPAYMSPEQIEIRPLDGRSDLYSLGVILYQMATGANPFSAKTPIESLMRHLKEPVPPPRQVNPELAVSPGLEALIQRCLEKDPNDRPATARELLNALNALAAGAGGPSAPGVSGWTGQPTAPARPSAVAGHKRGSKRLIAATFIALLVASGALAALLLTREPDRPTAGHTAGSGTASEQQAAGRGGPVATSPVAFAAPGTQAIPGAPTLPVAEAPDAGPAPVVPPLPAPDAAAAVTQVPATPPLAAGSGSGAPAEMPLALAAPPEPAAPPEEPKDEPTTPTPGSGTPAYPTPVATPTPTPAPTYPGYPTYPTYPGYPTPGVSPGTPAYPTGAPPAPGYPPAPAAPAVAVAAEPEPVEIPDDVDPCDVAVEYQVTCDRDWDDYVPTDCDVGDGPELHVIALYSPASADGHVPVHITRTVAPLVLALNAYGETTWDLDLAEGVVIDRIITSGYERSTVTGIPSSVRVEWRSGRRTRWPIMGWAWGDSGSWSGTELVEVAQDETHLALRSYVGCYNPSSYSLGQRWTPP